MQGMAKSAKGCVLARTGPFRKGAAVPLFLWARRAASKLKKDLGRKDWESSPSSNTSCRQENARFCAEAGVHGIRMLLAAPGRGCEMCVHKELFNCVGVVHGAKGEGEGAMG